MPGVHHSKVFDCNVFKVDCCSPFRFRRSNRIFAGLWFGKGKPHFPTFLRPFSIAIRELYHNGKLNTLRT